MSANVVSIEGRRCSKCNVLKDIAEFPVRSKIKGTRRTECRVCKNLYNSKYRKKNIRRFRALDKAKYWADPQKAYEDTKEWRKNNKDRLRIHAKKHKLKKKFGITLEQYNLMFQNQNGRCAICGGLEPGGPAENRFFAVDHCHATGRIRGLLCFACNKGLGHFYDNSDVLQRAVDYLKK